MRINADFTRPARLLPDEQCWVPSPQSGVTRVMLDRVGEEKARATSRVRYQAGSRFPAHDHPGGEEILVLSGTFSDESGDYPAGWYLRHPPGSRHAPFSRDGTEIFVKLWQMSTGERDVVRVDTRDPARWHETSQGRDCLLHDSEDERVRLCVLCPGSVMTTRPGWHHELLVLSGEMTVAGNALPAGSWLRLPPGQDILRADCAQGATVYLKQNRRLISP